MENHEIFLQCDKLFSSNLSHSAQVRFGQLEWYNIFYHLVFRSQSKIFFFDIVYFAAEILQSVLQFQNLTYQSCLFFQIIFQTFILQKGSKTAFMEIFYLVSLFCLLSIHNKTSNFFSWKSEDLCIFTGYWKLESKSCSSVHLSVCLTEYYDVIGCCSCICCSCAPLSV